MVPSTDLRPLKAALEANLGPGRVGENVPLAPFTTFRIGGPAGLFFRARTTQDLVTALLVAKEAEASTFLLGRGANILVADAGFRGLVVKCETEGFRFRDDHRLEAQAGALVFPDLTNATVGRGLGGLHHFVGIPSTVGGGMWQNLHFLSPDRGRTLFLEEVVESAEILSAEGARQEVSREYFRFGYDYSILHERPDIVLSVTFRLQPQPQDELREVVRRNLRWRDERHPDLWLYPSAGSVFKKVDGIGAGRLIDQCGLKGHVQGNAQIYHRHANIMVNLGGATSADVVALMELARETVLRRTGHELVPEITLVGDFG
jgi:UDP-N-acetylmuramate dehydrogenase